MLVQDGKIIIRTTDRGRFKRCRQYWDFTSPMRLDYEPERMAEPLEFGIAIHVGLETFYNPDCWELPLEVRKEKAIAAFVSTCKAQFIDLPTMFRNAQDVIDEYKERIALGKGMLDHYAEWSDKNDNFKPLATEVDFELPIPVPAHMTHIHQALGFHQINGYLYYHGTPVVYQGRIDMLVETEDGEIFVWDHKTAAKRDALDWITIDSQVSSYVWAATELGWGAVGFIYSEIIKDYPSFPRILKSGALSKDKSQGTTYDLYMQAIEANMERPETYADFLEYLKDNPKEYIRRRQEHREKFELDKQAEYIYNEALEMIAPLSIYPNPSKFNCNNCAFYDPCLARIEGSDEQYFLEDSGLYIKRTS